jgi:hypothetical protein
LGSIWLAFGLFGMPALVYWVGVALLGPYGDNANAGVFYANFFADLAAGSARAWTLALGPAVLISLLRLIFLRRPAPSIETQPVPDAATRQARPAAASAHRRVEPRVTLD